MSQPVTFAAGGPPSLDEIVTGIGAAKRALLSDPVSLRIQLVATAKLVNGPARYSRVPVHVVLAHKGNRWYGEVGLVEPSGDFGRDRRYFVAQGPTVLNWMRDNPHAVVTPFENGWNVFQQWTYVRQMGFEVNRQIAESGGADYEAIQKQDAENPDVTHPGLPDFLVANLRRYRVLPAAEVVDGHACWVVEWPGMDQMWIDAAHGFVLRRRVYHWGPGRPVRCEIQQRDCREVRPGLWAAFTQLVDEYANPHWARRGRWNTIDLETTTTVEKIEFDTVADDFFDCPLPARTVVLDGLHDTQFCVCQPHAVF